ncbi:8-oxo-dGTP pyrophosphatase MutT (NUDIX family) [Chitinivorax tropicus]|uniref:8-oxo-dGTP pyrophosphatase MutT (NUDIX family) n=1 Tax=Chitinivorax tropicus TaxID=714531 RepID=A0A840MQS9_9PROT|nr:8-oxo-dGTP pyrophosphatase MutT (NUDIX family) [Chitinivorax tropicus]
MFDSTFTPTRPNRLAVRLIVLSPDNRILLIRYHDDPPLHVNHPELTDYWCTPGGGLEPGETHEQAAARELMEETGLHGKIGPVIAKQKRFIRYPDSAYIQEEQYHVVRVPHTHVEPTALEPNELLEIQEFRWFSIDELAVLALPVIPFEFPQWLKENLSAIVQGNDVMECSWVL